MKKYITCNETTKLIGNLSNFGPSSSEELYQQLSHLLQNVKQLAIKIKLWLLQDIL